MNDKQYKSLAKKLRKYHDFSFNLRGKLTPQQKAAITKINNKLKKIIKDEEYIFITYAKHKNAKKIKGLRKNQRANKGVFIIHENAKISVDKKGNILRAYKKVGKKQLFSEYHYFSDELDYLDFIENPEEYISKYLKIKNINTVRMIVGDNHEGHMTYSLPAFNNYTKDLIQNEIYGKSAEFVQGIVIYYYK